jgi:hypothetical protein
MRLAGNPAGRFLFPTPNIMIISEPVFWLGLGIAGAILAHFAMAERP